MRNLTITLFTLAALLACCTDLEESTLGDSEIGTAKQAVMSEFMHEHFEIAKTLDHGVLATGMIDLPLPSSFVGNTQLHTTCGVTFVTPHYAITAGHCISQDQVWSRRSKIPVLEVDVSQVSDDHLSAMQEVFGVFPGYTQMKLTAGDGYNVTRYDNCVMEMRCWAGQHYMCPFYKENADIALIHCPERASDAEFMPVSTNPASSGPIEMYWYHEVLDLPAVQPDYADPLYYRWYYYARYLGKNYRFENYHYFGRDNQGFGDPRTQVLPLKSTTWNAEWDFEPRSRTGYDENYPTVIWTDMYGCHGTSGSGVFERVNGNLELLGPMVIPSRLQGNWSGNLCADGNAISPGERILAYTKQEYTKAFANMAITAEKRVYGWRPPGP
ncbi:MAG: hypothetical protein GY854_25670 [Deltaproteobacteria bacterium]|nr:hypothetical protein [Deltaproteobacteria bacterium]